MATEEGISRASGLKSENTTGNTTEDDGSEGEDDIYEVEKIVGMTTNKGKTLFKVRWAGYSPSWDTWEPYENLESCKDIVDDYIKTHTGKSTKSKQSSSSSASKVDIPSVKNNDTQSEAGSDSSKQSMKSKKATGYYYVDADGAEADTLKDKFWRNLEQGKINVFGNDMYSKVKNTGRLARPSSFKEVFQNREPVLADDDTPIDIKKRRLSKSTERRQSESATDEDSAKANPTPKSRTSATRKAVSAAAAAAAKVKEQHTVEFTAAEPEESPGRIKPQRSKAQTARKRITRILADSSSKELHQSEDVDSEHSDSETPNSSSNGRGSEASYGSTEEEVQAEDTRRTTYEHEVAESVDDSPTELQELYESEEKLQRERAVAKTVETKKEKPKYQPQVEVEVIDLVDDDDTDTDCLVENVSESRRTRTRNSTKGSDSEATLDSSGEGSRRDQQLASPCKVVVRRILTKSVQPLDESADSGEMKDEYEVQIVERKREIETDDNANVRQKGSEERHKKRKSTDTFLSQAAEIAMDSVKQAKQTTDTVAKKRKGRKSSNVVDVSCERGESGTIFEESTEPIGPPMGAAQQAASLFRTKASVKIYDPTQTSSPNSSEQSHTPQTPDVSIRTPQTPVTPEGSSGNAHGQQPLSVNSNVSEGQHVLVQPSPSSVIPSPTTPRTPSTSGNDEGLFDIDLDEIDLSAWDSVVPADATQSEGLELSNVEFRHAVHTNNYEKARGALSSRRKYDLEQPDAQGMTLVMVAAHLGYDDVMELLVYSGADVNARQKNGMTALMHACQQGHRCTVELLILLGAFVNPHQHNGETALFKGVRRGNKHIVRLLLEHGANFAAQAQDNTALKYAKQLPNSAEIIDVLNSHITNVTSEFETQVQITLNNTAKIQCALFSMQCFALCEADKFRITFNHDLQPTRPGVGMLLFIAHAKFTKQEVKCRFYGPCAVASAVLNGVTLHPLTEEANFVLSFSPLHHGRNDLDVHAVKAPKSKAKLVVCAYKAQLT